MPTRLYGNTPSHHPIPLQRYPSKHFKTACKDFNRLPRLPFLTAPSSDLLYSHLGGLHISHCPDNRARYLTSRETPGREHDSDQWPRPSNCRRVPLRVLLNLVYHTGALRCSRAESCAGVDCRVHVHGLHLPAGTTAEQVQSCLTFQLSLPYCSCPVRCIQFHAPLPNLHYYF